MLKKVSPELINSNIVVDIFIIIKIISLHVVEGMYVEQQHN